MTLSKEWNLLAVSILTMLVLSVVFNVLMACGAGSIGDKQIGIVDKEELTKTASTSMFQILTSVLPEPVSGMPYQAELEAAGGWAPYTWTIIDGNLPAGLSFDTGGTISGTPLFDDVEKRITFSVTDMGGTVLKCEFTMKVAIPAGSILRITSASLSEAVYGTEYSGMLDASGGQPPYSWSVTSGSLPSGLSLNSETGIISGAPAEAGSMQFAITVTDSSNKTASTELLLLVRVDTLQITTDLIPTGAINVPYYFPLAAYGGKPPYKWEIVVGSLPNGLSLNEDTGAIYGKPTEFYSKTIAISISDTNFHSVYKNFDMKIGGVTITTGSLLPDATGSIAYSKTLTAVGDKPPYTWAVTFGKIPDGLSIDANTGQIFGIPVVSGNFVFTVTATNGTDNANREFYLRVIGDFWAPTSTGVNCPSERWLNTVVWTGDTGNPATSNKMIIWGGGGAVTDNTGSIYDPATNTWTPTSTGANCPPGGILPSAVWTGDTGNPATSYKMIVWGGRDGAANPLNVGGIYDPETDTWVSTSIGANCPSARWGHTGIWTGDTGNPATSYKMIVWGGQNGVIYLNSGAIYDPATNTWASTSLGPNCPSARTLSGVNGIWTGNTGNALSSYKMIIWGGFDGANYFNDGGIYNPETNSWTLTSTGANCPSQRYKNVSVWTGDTGNPATAYRMIIWAGFDGVTVFNDGGIYDPLTNTWTATSTDANCPIARAHGIFSVWTGTRLFVWAGFDGIQFYNTGGIYDPETNSWSATSTGVNCPVARRSYINAVWTGNTGDTATSNKIIIWGGVDSLGAFCNSGGVYTP